MGERTLPRWQHLIETRTPNLHRATIAQQRVRMEGWRQRRLGSLAPRNNGKKHGDRKKCRKPQEPLDTDRPSHGRTLVLRGLVGSACGVYKCVVNESVCPRCAAVVAVPQCAVCSNCSYDFSSPTARLRLVASRYLWLIVLVPFAVVTIRSGLVFSAIVALFVLLAMGFSHTEKMRQSLSLNVPKVHAPVSMSKPELPAEWEPIARVPRPRDVYSTPTAKVWGVLGAAGCLVGAVFCNLHTLEKPRTFCVI